MGVGKISTMWRGYESLLSVNLITPSFHVSRQASSLDIFDIGSEHSILVFLCLTIIAKAYVFSILKDC